MKSPIKNQSGNVLFYILIAVVLIAALSYVMARGAGDSGAGMVANRLSEQIKSQAQSIRSAILECNLVRGFGYPADPANPYTLDLVQCQIDSTPTYETLFSGATGRFVPQAPAPLDTTGWIYRNTGGDVYIELTEAMDCAGDQGVASAFNILQSQFASTEITGTTCDGVTATFRLYLVDA